jgi:endonuclease G
MKNLFLLIFISISLLATAQKDTLVTKKIYTVLYSQKLKQPIWLEYSVKTTVCNAKRDGLDFYTEKGIATSTNLDYANNDYDKGHMAPAAAFCQSKESMYLTFSYLNCSLQHYKLNRGVWKELEALEREWAKTELLSIHIDVHFSKNPVKTPGGASIPEAYTKTIYFTQSKKKLVYYFPNSIPAGKLDTYLKK